MKIISGSRKYDVSALTMERNAKFQAIFVLVRKVIASDIRWRKAEIRFPFTYQFERLTCGLRLLDMQIRVLPREDV
ncbi:hypothetical protein D3C81_1883390 [compost metagenome]